MKRQVVQLKNRCLLKEDIQMDNKNMKGCWTSLVFSETQIRTTTKHQCTLTRMAAIEKIDYNKY